MNIGRKNLRIMGMGRPCVISSCIIYNLRNSVGFYSTPTNAKINTYFIKNVLKYREVIKLMLRLF